MVVICRMSGYENLQNDLRAAPKRWAVTGAAGFIGSHLLETLLRLDQEVFGLDVVDGGNLEAVRSLVTAEQWARFKFIKGDIRDASTCKTLVQGADYVLHQAAMCSVALSIERPLEANAINVDGFLNILTAAREAGVKRVVYASSSAVYGDRPGLPKRESDIVQTLSPYAATKYVNELYADVFGRMYGLESVGMRYFNVFGTRQDPNGAYAAVIPKWIQAILQGEPVTIHGDGSTTRDFCPVENVVQINLLAACIPGKDVCGQVYNVGMGQTITLNELYDYLRVNLLAAAPSIAEKAVYAPFRAGDIRHSMSDIGKAKADLGYDPGTDISAALRNTLNWYLSSRREVCD